MCVSAETQSVWYDLSEVLPDGGSYIALLFLRQPTEPVTGLPPREATQMALQAVPEPQGSS